MGARQDFYFKEFGLQCPVFCPLQPYRLGFLLNSAPDWPNKFAVTPRFLPGLGL